jgi:MoaA/NifB/PqqE/SkfB family radical SAM enzyme
MIRSGEVEPFLAFLASLGIHKAWRSETKPAIEVFWTDTEVITPAEQQQLMDLQDRYNRQGRMTVNYLGHFESGRYFGCNAGYKMVYIDVCSGVSPCVFMPMLFGNVRDRSIESIWQDMSLRFASKSECFINKNYGILKKHAAHGVPCSPENSVAILEEVTFGLLSLFNRLHFKGDIQ